ncbi:hypothetical protein HPB48_020501 [Haemaphysalis longicornis]|uniref:Uncharacterized protein n=1 Tax=Haemaphysalis longicornis TaxID=44386 RepID=A0A9J6GDY4_HAELO|nr:hypothetical protein HPB48_020501 [Haemaphysalis longicornis]
MFELIQNWFWIFNKSARRTETARKKHGQFQVPWRYTVDEIKLSQHLSVTTSARIYDLIDLGEFTA